MIKCLLDLDGEILLWIQENLRNPFLTEIFSFITHLGDSGAIWILISIIFLILKRTREVGFVSLLSLLGSYIINNLILKNLIARIRPYEMVLGLNLLIERQKDLSFPSGHTGSSFACAVILYLMLPKKYGVPALILAVLIAFSRLYLGVHYPSDVVAGMVTGTIIAFLVWNGFKKIDKKYINNRK